MGNVTDNRDFISNNFDVLAPDVLAFLCLSPFELLNHISEKPILTQLPGILDDRTWKPFLKTSFPTAQKGGEETYHAAFVRETRALLERLKETGIGGRSWYYGGPTSPLKHASRALRRDRIFMLEAVKRDAVALRYASQNLKSNRDIVHAAVLKDRRAFRFAAEEFQSDREIVLAAVKQDWRALGEVSSRLHHELFFYSTSFNLLGSLGFCTALILPFFAPIAYAVVLMGVSILAKKESEKFTVYGFFALGSKPNDDIDEPVTSQNLA